jgi:tetratricopeptide (TPR) repeat protein
MRSLWAAAAASLLWAGSALAAQDPKPVPDPGLDHERAMLAAVYQHIQQHDADLKDVQPVLEAILSDTAFTRLSTIEQHAATIIYGAVLYDEEKYDTAKDVIAQASSMRDAGAGDWDLRLKNSYALSDYADAARATAKIARNWPNLLREYRDEAIFRVADEAQKPVVDPQTADEMLSALFDAKWKPKSPFKVADALWFGLARIRLKEGDAAGAKEAAAVIGDPEVLMWMRSDKRFDALVAADPAHYDVMKAYDTMLAAERAASATAPDKLEGIVRVADTLYVLNRMQESLDLLDSALGRAKAKPDAFSDTGAQLNWALDQRSRALFRLGRDDDGFRALESGASEKENDMRVNVSQAINLAGEYDVHDRPKDALRAVAKLEPSDMSPYGRMSLEDARAYAYFELGDKDNLTKTLDYMKAHAQDGTQPYLDTMLFIGDLDAAAAHVIAQLQDPATRPGMLYFLQTYLPIPNATPRETDIRARWTALRARPDVAAAIGKAGRVESYALMSPSY